MWHGATMCTQDEHISGQHHLFCLFTVLKVVLRRSPQLHSWLKGQRCVHSKDPSEMNSRIAEDDSIWQPLSFLIFLFFFLISFWWECLVFLFLR